MKVRSDGGEVFFDVTMHDAWVWDIYRPARFVKKVRVVTFKDVNVEELAQARPRAAPSEGLTARPARRASAAAATSGHRGAASST